MGGLGSPDGWASACPANYDALQFLGVLRLSGASYLDQAWALLRKGHGASLVLDLLLGAEPGLSRKLGVGAALARECLLPLASIAWALEAQGINPASLAFTMGPDHLQGCLQALNLEHTFQDWRIRELRHGAGWVPELEVDPLTGFLPPGLVLPGWHMRICRNPCLVDLELDMVVGALVLQDCPSLKRIRPQRPTGELFAQPNGCPTLHLAHCPCLEFLPEGLAVQEELSLVELPALRKLPTGLLLGRHLVLRSCHRLERLPENLEVPGDLVLEDLPSLRGLPASLRVGGTIRTRCCPNPRASLRPPPGPTWKLGPRVAPKM